jgi:hypothetical protein
MERDESVRCLLTTRKTRIRDNACALNKRRNCWQRCFLCDPCRGCITRTPTACDSKIWSQVPRDSDPRKTALARASSTYKRQTRPLVREGALQEQDRNCHISNKYLVVSPKWVLCSKTDWSADRRS